MDEQTTLHTNEKNHNEGGEPKNTNLVTRRFEAEKPQTDKEARDGYGAKSPSGTLSVPLNSPLATPSTEKDIPVPQGRTFVQGGKI